MKKNKLADSPNDLLVEFENKYNLFEVTCGGYVAWSLLRDRVASEIRKKIWPAGFVDKAQSAYYSRKWKIWESLGRLLCGDSIFFTFAPEYRLELDSKIANINSYILQELVPRHLVVQLSEEGNQWDRRRNLCEPLIDYDCLIKMAGKIGCIKQRYEIGQAVRGELESAATIIHGWIKDSKFIPPENLSLDIIKNSLIDSFDRALQIQALFEFFEVKNIFVNQSYGWEHIILAAKMTGVRICEFQHGVITDEHPGYGWSPVAAPYRDKMIVPDKILVYGDYWKRLLVQGGFWRLEDIAVIGNLSVYAARMERVRIARRTGSGLRKRVLYTSQPSSNGLAQRWMREFIDWYLKKYDELNFDLQVRVHPFHGGCPVAEELRGLDHVTVIDSRDKTDTNMLIAKSDVHISTGSTCMFESIAIGVPTVFMGVQEYDYVHSRLSELGAITFKDGGKFAEYFDAGYIDVEANGGGNFDLYAKDVDMCRKEFLER